jgi:hypothetical protein
MVVENLGVSKTGIYKAGDCISFTGIKGVNKRTLASTGVDFQVTVTADTNSDPAGEAIVSFTPAIIFDTANPNRNVTGQVVATTPVVAANAATGETDYAVNVGWARDGLIVACPPPAPLWGMESRVIRDPKTGYSLRVSYDGNILQNTNTFRVDILPAVLWLRDRAVKLLTKANI